MINHGFQLSNLLEKDFSMDKDKEREERRAKQQQKLQDALDRRKDWLKNNKRPPTPKEPSTPPIKRPLGM